MPRGCNGGFGIPLILTGQPLVRKRPRQPPVETREWMLILSYSRRIPTGYDAYAAARPSTRCCVLAQASGVRSLTCQWVIVGSRVTTSRR